MHAQVPNKTGGPIKKAGRIYIHIEIDVGST